eukprot:13499848-Heterocapsa_arctica.AAC.1
MVNPSRNDNNSSGSSSRSSSLYVLAYLYAYVALGRPIADERAPGGRRQGLRGRRNICIYIHL